MWALVETSANPDDLRAFLQAYPNGRFAPAARLKLQQLERQQRPQVAVGVPPSTPAEAPRLTTLRNSIGMEFVLIPAETFQMGSNDGHDNEKPVHEVRISKADIYRPRWPYLLIDESRYSERRLVRMQNLVAALFRLENSRSPADIQRVLAVLIIWLRDPEQESLRRAFTMWLQRVLLPARLPAVPIPEMQELVEVQSMLAERVIEWTQQWKEEGLREGRREGLQQGLQEGLQQGLQEGLQQGLQAGLAAGPGRRTGLAGAACPDAFWGGMCAGPGTAPGDVYGHGGTRRHRRVDRQRRQQ